MKFRSRSNLSLIHAFHKILKNHIYCPMNQVIYYIKIPFFTINIIIFLIDILHIQFNEFSLIGLYPIISIPDVMNLEYLSHY